MKIGKRDALFVVAWAVLTAIAKWASGNVLFDITVEYLKTHWGMDEAEIAAAFAGYLPPAVLAALVVFGIYHLGKTHGAPAPDDPLLAVGINGELVTPDSIPKAGERERERHIAFFCRVPRSLGNMGYSEARSSWPGTWPEQDRSA